ncbi:MAG: cytidylate kinase-like family protein, partial [Desulfarculus sp.]|nr:cytidylate kinase-like family protein [Pseudomonadota bacterium]MBV1753969.1 cytidylate kinase-like family protein [Desulfarculus sp.]
CTEEKANQIIIQSDRDRFGYVRALFNEDWDDISLYDLVINTNTMSLETAVKMIAFAVEANEFNNSPEVLEKCRELSLTQKAVADHLDIPDLESKIINAMGEAEKELARPPFIRRRKG